MIPRVHRSDGNWPQGFRVDEVKYPAGDLTLSNDPCSYDDVLLTVIHRFDTGSYICRCGQDNVQAKIDERNEKEIARGTSWSRRKRVRKSSVSSEKS